MTPIDPLDDEDLVVIDGTYTCEFAGCDIDWLHSHCESDLDIVLPGTPVGPDAHRPADWGSLDQSAP